MEIGLALSEDELVYRIMSAQAGLPMEWEKQVVEKFKQTRQKREEEAVNALKRKRTVSLSQPAQSQ